MNNADFVAERLRERVCLEFCRADSRVRNVKMQSIVEITKTQAQRIAAQILRHKLRVEIHRLARIQMIKLAIQPHLSIRPDILQEHRLAPTMMGKDHIRL